MLEDGQLHPKTQIRNQKRQDLCKLFLALRCGDFQSWNQKLPQGGSTLKDTSPVMLEYPPHIPPQD